MALRCNTKKPFPYIFLLRWWTKWTLRGFPIQNENLLKDQGGPGGPLVSCGAVDAVAELTLVIKCHINVDRPGGRRLIHGDACDVQLRVKHRVAAIDSGVVARVVERADALKLLDLARALDDCLVGSAGVHRQSAALCVGCFADGVEVLSGRDGVAVRDGDYTDGVFGVAVGVDDAETPRARVYAVLMVETVAFQRIDQLIIIQRLMTNASIIRIMKAVEPKSVKGDLSSTCLVESDSVIVLQGAEEAVRNALEEDSAGRTTSSSSLE